MSVNPLVLIANSAALAVVHCTPTSWTGRNTPGKSSNEKSFRTFESPFGTVESLFPKFFKIFFSKITFVTVFSLLAHWHFFAFDCFRAKKKVTQKFWIGRDPPSFGRLPWKSAIFCWMASLSDLEWLKNCLVRCFGFNPLVEHSEHYTTLHFTTLY